MKYKLNKKLPPVPSIALALAVFCGLSTSAFLLPAAALDQNSASTPQLMQEIKLRYVADDIDPNSFAGQPRYCYRAGDTYGRIEEAVDKKLNLHGLIVIACPDVWIINLADKTGKHLVDNAPAVHMPVLASHQSPFVELEFGREIEFFKSRNVAAVENTTGSTKTFSYKYQSNGIELELIVDADSIPQKLLIASPQGKRTLEYLTYKTLPFDAEKFSKPADVSYSDAVAVNLGSGQNASISSENADSEDVSSLTDSLFAAGASKKEFNTMNSKAGGEPLVEPKSALSSLTSGKDLWQWMTYYYLFPAPELTASAIHLLEKEGALDKESAIAPSASFISRLFLQNPGLMQKCLKDVDDLSAEHKKAFLPLTLRLTRTPEAIAEAEKIEQDIPAKDRIITHANLAPDKLDTFFISAPSDLDMLWGCFFATGDKRYVQKIISTISWSKKLSGNINKISIGAAAVWSLTSNAEQHKLVMQILKDESKIQPELRADLNKIVEKATAESNT